MDNQQESLLIPIPEYINYFTDGKGNIFSTKRSNTPKQLKCFTHYGKSKNPYQRVKIMDRLWLAHRFIGAIHVGRQLLPCEVVNHINGNTSDNSLDNLEVVTQRQNVDHAVVNNLYCKGDAWYEARGLRKK